MAKSTKLTDLEIKEASAVDHPAHLHEGWIVLKSQTDELDEAIIVADEVTTETETGADINVDLHDETIQDDAVETDAAPELEPVAASVAGPDDSSPFQKELADLRKELADAREAHAGLVDERELEKATDVAHNWAILPELTPTEFAPVLRTLRAACPEEMAYVEKVLAAAAIAIKESGTFNELGTDVGAESDDAWGKIQALANSMVEKGESASLAKAVASIAVTEPALYTQYLTEKEG